MGSTEMLFIDIELAFIGMNFHSPASPILIPRINHRRVSPPHFDEGEREFVFKFWWGFSIIHILAFPHYAYYNTCNEQKRQIMLNTIKILCKKTSYKS